VTAQCAGGCCFKKVSAGNSIHAPSMQRFFYAGNWLLTYNAPISKMKTKDIKQLWVAACVGMVVGTWRGDAERIGAASVPTKGEYLRIADEVEANLRSLFWTSSFPRQRTRKAGVFRELRLGLDPAAGRRPKASCIRAASPGPARKWPSVSLPGPICTWP